MSTDLQLHHALPKLRISTTIIKTNIPSDQNDVVDDDRVKIKQVIPEPDTGNNDDSYTTPTSKESRIPAILMCPAAPRKVMKPPSCKRKLLNEFQFFDVANKDEMDSFFRSTFPKRTCRCS